MDSLKTDATRIANIVDSVMQHRLASVHDQIRNLQQTVASRDQKVADILQYLKTISAKLGVAVAGETKPVVPSSCTRSDGAVSRSRATSSALAGAESKESDAGHAVWSAFKPVVPAGEHERTSVKPTLEEIAAQIVDTLPDERRHVNMRDPPVFLLHPRGRRGKGVKLPSRRSTRLVTTPVVANAVTHPVTGTCRKRAAKDSASGVPNAQKHTVQSASQLKVQSLCSPSSSSSAAPGHANKRARAASVHTAAVDSSAPITIDFSVHDRSALVADLDPNDPMLGGADLTAMSLNAYTPAIPPSPPTSSESATGLTTAPPASSGSGTAGTTRLPAPFENELQKGDVPPDMGASTDDSDSESIEQAMTSLLKTAENVLQTRADTTSEDEDTIDDARTPGNLSFPMIAKQSYAGASDSREATEASQSGFPTTATNSFSSVVEAATSNFPFTASPSDFPTTVTETSGCFPATVPDETTATRRSLPHAATEVTNSFPTTEIATRENYVPTTGMAGAGSDFPTTATAVAPSDFPTSATAVAVSDFSTPTRAPDTYGSSPRTPFAEKESSSSSVPTTAIHSTAACTVQQQPTTHAETTRDVGTRHSIVSHEASTCDVDDVTLWEEPCSEAPADARAAASETGASNSASGALQEMRKTSGELAKAAVELWDGPPLAPSSTAGGSQESCNVPVVKNSHAAKGKGDKSGKSGKKGKSSKGGGKTQRGKWHKGAKVDTTTNQSTTKTASSWLNSMYDKPTTKQSVTLPQSVNFNPLGFTSLSFTQNANSNPLGFTSLSSMSSTQADFNSLFGNAGSGEMIF